MIERSWDVIVIGGGHAGIEAAHAAAKMGASTLLITLRRDRVGFMSCNPAIGGLAKGQLVKEIDALGGFMGMNTDRSAIQYRILNSSKGPAVRSSRAQCDKALYATEAQKYLSKIIGLTMIEAEADQILLEAGRRVTGIRIKTGEEFRARAVVVTSGTFLRAVMFTGEKQEQGGRAGDTSAQGLSGSLERMGFRLRRLKTGTPPRLHRRSIDWSKTVPQPGDERPVPFSFYFRPEKFPILPQVNCYVTYTNEKTHEIIEKNFDRSPMFTGVIQGVGPRYCPSIEDKVKRFRTRERHQLFLEPEGLTTDEIYVNGISTSLPSDVQEQFVRSVAGLEQAEFIRYGYAVEYDAIDCRQFHTTLESKDIAGLFLAGQVNGTSGYEEAAAQGLIAGINAASTKTGAAPFVLSRFDSYIGVLIDDLTTKGSDEPYRMFTSRAEYRLHLREDNADLRLAELGFKAGLLPAECFAQVNSKRQKIESERTGLCQRFVYPAKREHVEWFGRRGLVPPKDRVSAEQLLKRPEMDWQSLCELGLGSDASLDIAEQVVIQVKYDGYIKRDEEMMSAVQKSERIRIPLELQFECVPGLSSEIIGRLQLTRPETLGQMSRMQGVTPAAVANVLIYLRTHEHRNPQT